MAAVRLRLRVCGARSIVQLVLALKHLIAAVCSLSWRLWLCLINILIQLGRVCVALVSAS